MDLFDADTARRTIELFRSPDAVVELRIIGSHRGTISGYFDDMTALLKEAEYWSGKAGGVYFTPNPVLPDLLARAYNRVREFAKTTTGDKEILHRTWLPIDCDVIRPADISANDCEWQAAIERTKAVGDYLAAHNCPSVLGDSGNGGHVSVPIDLPNEEASKDLCQSILKSLSTRFSDERVKVDLTTFNASRIWKLYGTQARKGDAIPGRPHRLARLLDVPTGLAPVTREKLLTLVDEADAAKVPVAALNGSSASPAASGDYSTLNIAAWFQSRGVYGRAMAGGKHAVECPWKAEHSTTRRPNESDTCIWEAAGGAWPQFHCLHDHCVGRTIQDVLALWPDAAAYCDRPWLNGWVVPEREARTELQEIVEAAEQLDTASAVRKPNFLTIQPLRIIETTPRRFVAMVNGRELELREKELTRWDQFKHQVEIRLYFVPILPNVPNKKDLSPQTIWEQYVLDPALRHAAIEAAPDDASAEGALWETVKHFFQGRRHETKDVVFDYRLAEVDGWFWFRGDALRRWLDHRQRKGIEEDELWNTVRKRGGKPCSVKSKGRICTAWKIPTTALDDVEEVANERITEISHEVTSVIPIRITPISYENRGGNA